MNGLLQLRYLGDCLQCTGEVQEISIGNVYLLLERSSSQRSGWEAPFVRSRSYPELCMLVKKLSEGMCVLCRNGGEG